jgi:hypothetical protein
MKEISLENTAVTAAALVTVGEVVLNHDHFRICVEVQNNGAAAGDDLADFALDFKAHVNGNWLTYASDTDWAGTLGMLGFVTTAPNTLAKGATTFINVSPGHIYAIRFRAKAAATKTTSVKILGMAKGPVPG